MNKTLVRGIEAFVLVVLSGFLTDIAAIHQPIDLTKPDSQAAIITALIAAVGIAVRQYTASPGNGTTPPTSGTTVK